MWYETYVHPVNSKECYVNRSGRQPFRMAEDIQPKHVSIRMRGFLFRTCAAQQAKVHKKGPPETGGPYAFKRIVIL